MSGPFHSLIINRERTFREIRRRSVAQVVAKKAITVKRGKTYPRQAKPKEGSRAQPMRIHEAVTEKRSDTWQAPYAPRKSHPRSKAKDDLPFRPKFKMTYKELGTAQ